MLKNKQYMKHLKLFDDNASFQEFKEGEIDYPVVAVAESKVHVFGVTKQVPTMRYKTSGSPIDPKTEQKAYPITNYLYDYLINHYYDDTSGEWVMEFSEDLPDNISFGGLQGTSRDGYVCTHCPAVDPHSQAATLVSDWPIHR